MLRIVSVLLFLTAIPLNAQSRLTPIEIPEAVERLLDAYEVAWAGQDAPALAALFTPDGIALPPDAPPAVGREAIERAYQGVGGPLDLRAYRFEVNGDLAYVVGGFARYPGEPDLGKFVLVLRRTEDGDWLILADMDNVN